MAKRRPGAEEAEAFLTELLALYKVPFGQKAETWVAAMASQLAALRPTPTQLSELVDWFGTNWAEEFAPTWPDIRQAYEALPGPRQAALLANPVGPEMEECEGPDGAVYLRAKCRACQGSGMMSRYRDRGARAVLLDSYEDQILMTPREFAALLAAAGEHGAVSLHAEWCKCKYGAYRQQLQLSDGKANKAKQIDKARRRSGGGFTKAVSSPSVFKGHWTDDD